MHPRTPEKPADLHQINLPRREAKPLGFTALRQWLRHRHPMVLLDRIVDHEPGEFLDALVCVSGNLDFIAGHFPERAIYPGSHLIQAFAQAGIILFQMSTSPLKEDEMTLVSSVEARFLKMVVPGDQVMLQLKVDRIVQNLFSFSAQARVGSTRVAACRINLARARVADVGSPLW